MQGYSTRQGDVLDSEKIASECYSPKNASKQKVGLIISEGAYLEFPDGVIAQTQRNKGAEEYQLGGWYVTQNLYYQIHDRKSQSADKHVKYAAIQKRK